MIFIEPGAVLAQGKKETTMTAGETRRTKPRLNIKRGFAGNEPQSITHSAPPTAGQDIKSGMLIVLVNGAWVKCDSDEGGHKNLVPHFALQDQTDTDVVSSGELLGLSCAGNFEVQTGYCDAEAYTEGAPVIKSANAGYVDLGASFLAAIETIGYVGKGGYEDVVAYNSEATPSNGHQYVLNVVTAWKPAQQ
jgi:hypothetical protein